MLRSRSLSKTRPVVLGGAMIVPVGLLRTLDGTTPPFPTFAQDTERSEMLAMNAVMEAERQLGHVPRDVSDRNLGYDVERQINGALFERISAVTSATSAAGARSRSAGGVSSSDLLFFNRALNCLVAFELKVVEFEPEHLAKIQFYLEALDGNVRKLHEQPSIGVLLCATKNHEVVEYAPSRAMSPALVAEYQARLLARTELTEGWNPTTDKRLTVWETAQHPIRTLETNGEPEAAALLNKLGGIGELAREPAYRLYPICERKKWAEEALAYNGLVIAWPELTKVALAQRTRTGQTQHQMF